MQMLGTINEGTTALIEVTTTDDNGAVVPLSFNYVVWSGDEEVQSQRAGDINLSTGKTLIEVDGSLRVGAVNPLTLVVECTAGLPNGKPLTEKFRVNVLNMGSKT